MDQVVRVVFDKKHNIIVGAFHDYQRAVELTIKLSTEADPNKKYRCMRYEMYTLPLNTETCVFLESFNDELAKWRVQML